MKLIGFANATIIIPAEYLRLKNIRGNETLLLMNEIVD